jgi:hypothetical protein
MPETPEVFMVSLMADPERLERFMSAARAFNSEMAALGVSHAQAIKVLANLNAIRLGTNGSGGGFAAPLTRAT